jgi:hypothetical protein
MTTATAFEAVISVWNEQIRCEMSTKLGGQCQRPAYWRLDLHGCETVLMCGHHKQRWLRRTLFNCRQTQLACAHCRRPFASVDDVCRIMPL